MKLLILAPCDKVIIDKLGNPSLISIIQNLNVEVPADNPVPSNAVVPREWYIFSHWLVADEEIGREFVQRTVIVLPSGDVFGDPATGSSVPFKAKDISANIAQVIVNLNGFPIGMAGPITVKVWIEEGGKSVTDVIAYPLRVVHVEPKTPVTALTS